MRNLFLFSGIICCLILRAGGGIHFSEAKWAEAKTQAQKENKYIFVDCYTDWCYWCKVMDKETFTDTTVANRINSQFIPLKREMEKEEEGLALGMKYHVNGYPTYLIFSPAGELIYKIVGSRPAELFMQELDSARVAKGPLVPGFGPELDPGYPHFYKESFGTNKKRKSPEQKTVIDFLDKQTDLFSEVSWSVMWRFPLNEKYDEWILMNRTKLISLYGAEEVNDKVASILEARSSRAARENNKAGLDATLAQTKLYLPEQYGFLSFQFTMNYYETNEDWKNYAGTMQSFIDTAGYRATGTINGVCWNIYEQCEDKPVVKQALAWMDSICIQTESYAFEDTYAALLYKDGQYKKAEEVALHAIDLGKQAGEDVSGTEALLANIRLKIK